MRTVLAMALCLLVATGQAWAETTKAPAAPRSRSVAKKVLFTALGAAGGFAAGLYIGLRNFDEAINSDRKVWTCIIIGSAAGGVAGAFLAPDRAANSWTSLQPTPGAPELDPSHSRRVLNGNGLRDEDRALLARVRKVSEASR